MTTPIGTISLSDVQDEFGGSHPISITEYYGCATGVPTSGTISMDDLRGISAVSDRVWSGSMSRTGGTGKVASFSPDGSDAQKLNHYYDSVFKGAITYNPTTGTFSGTCHPGVQGGSFVLYGTSNTIKGSIQVWEADTSGYFSWVTTQNSGTITWNESAGTWSGSISWVGGTTATITGSGSALVGSNAYSGTVYLS
jgi:hypothetical protein